MYESLVCNDEFYHIDCCVYIINLVVQDGLKDIDDVIGKICDSIKYVKVSYRRKENFKEPIKLINLDSN